MLNRLCAVAFVGTLVSLSMLTFADAKPAPCAAARRGTAKPAATTKSNSGATAAACNNYLNRVRAKVDKNWYVADGKNHVVLSVVVAPDGTVTDLNITSTPTDTKAEQAASDAFNQSQPLEALPSGSKAMKMTLTFDSNADPHGDSSRTIGARLDPVTTKP